MRDLPCTGNASDRIVIGSAGEVLTERHVISLLA
jgi:hypothetical protein